MTYICIKCKAIWVVGEPTAEFSGGLCDKCLTKWVRSRQIEKGFEPCFRRAVEVCSRTECTYHELCCRSLYEEFDETPQDYFEHNTCQLHISD